ncbi:MAG: hypothetical protein JOY91_12495 [Sinobacteraceae bacterium]|nr:hypothetical protein [Nevskiaceae bacterium]
MLQTRARVGHTESRSPASGLLHTKLYRPRTRGDLVRRARLLVRLDAGLAGGVTLVSAPAGYGKTTLLADWLQALDRPVAWLSLDAEDDDPRLFVRLLAAALQTAFPGAFGATASLFNAPQFPPPDQLASLLLSDLADAPDDVVVVLDDYHLMHSGEVHALVARLIERRPSQLHLVLASRFDPPLPLGEWQAIGLLNELRGSDLRFTREELEAFLAVVLGERAAQETAGLVGEATEGWIALARLAMLSLRTTADPAGFLQRLGRFPGRDISSYLVEEVLAGLAPDVQELLERISVLEHFCAPLCAALMGTEACSDQLQATLGWLEHAGLFLVPLDERQGWYRLHHLFQGLLQQRLREHTSKEELAELHRRASAWYAAQRLTEEALRHALAAGDTREAGRLVEERFLWAFEQDQWGTMERWLRRLPEEQIQASPDLLVARAWTAMVRGQIQYMAQLLEEAERLLATSGAGMPDASQESPGFPPALIAMFRSRAQLSMGQMEAALQSALSAQEQLRPGEEYVAAWTLTMLALARPAAGQEEVALAELQQALSAFTARPAITARLLQTQVISYKIAGRLPQLEHTARHMLRLAQEADLVLIQNWAHWLLGAVSYEWNQLEAAIYHFSAVLADRHRAHAVAVQESMFGLALAYQAQGLTTRAQETAETLLEWARGQHALPLLLLAYACCGELALLRGEVEEAAQWLDLAGEYPVTWPMEFLEDPPITRARMLLERSDQASVAQGQALLHEIEQHVRATHTWWKTIKVLALQARAYELQEREAEALDVLERALVLARPGGFIRTFTDVPGLARLFQELRKRSKTRQPIDQALDAYQQRLLVEMRPGIPAGLAPDELLRQEGLDPLTARELHILGLLEQELTNKAIARDLGVTPETVKAHTSNLYRKLAVDNRRAAVTLARALGLLAAPPAPPSQAL